MPNYTFYDTTSDEEWTETMTCDEMEEFLKKNRHIQWVPQPIPQGDSVRMGLRKPDDGFRDLLRTVKKGSPGSDVNTF